MTRSRWRAPLALTLALGLTVSVAACGKDKKDDTASSTTVAGPTIRMAPQDFSESKTLTQVYAQYLRAKGFNVTVQKPDGFRDQVYPDIEANKFDLLIDYTGSAARFLDKTKPGSNDPDTMAATLAAELAPKGLVAFPYAKAAQDANALVALTSWANANGIKMISDLSKLSGAIKLGGAPDCLERVDCYKGYTDPAIYGLKIDFKQVDYGPPLIAALDSGTEQVVQYGTTFPGLATGKYVALKDDKGVLSADNVVPVLRKALADLYGAKLRSAIDAISTRLTSADLLQWNVSTDTNKEEPADVAKAWLTDKGLL